MATILCTQCGAPFQPGDTKCQYCGCQRMPETQQPYNGTPVQVIVNQDNGNDPIQVILQQQGGNSAPIEVILQQQYSDIDPKWPIRSKYVAGILSIFFGGLGIHKFYLGRIVPGILYVVFFWSGIPSFLGVAEGIIYLCSSDHDFQVKNKCRLSRPTR